MFFSSLFVHKETNIDLLLSFVLMNLGRYFMVLYHRFLFFEYRRIITQMILECRVEAKASFIENGLDYYFFVVQFIMLIHMDIFDTGSYIYKKNT
jgi:hypothetical protein